MSQQFNVRLPEYTLDQINAIRETRGLTKTQVVILAVDRLSNALNTQDADAEHEVKRLKTVARIAPHLDLGSDDSGSSTQGD